MTPRLTIAYENPCARADDTTHQRFAAFMRPWFSIVTVNK